MQVNIYGQASLADDVCSLCDDYNLFLQDPIGCDRIVEYRNLHRLSFLDTVATLTCISREAEVVSETTRGPIDFLNGFETGAELPAQQPTALQTQLHKHQKQGLEFMLRREEGWQLHTASQDLWSKVLEVAGSSIYINNITGGKQVEAPPPFGGGIIADHMGLGKSLSMIALITSSIDNTYHNLNWSQTSNITPRNGSTLLVVPSTLLGSWEEQLEKHLVPGSLSWTRHHGKRRLSNADELDRFDLVLTTFQTLASEWKKAAQAPCLVFSNRWRRIVLDEGTHSWDTTSDSC